jgi:hypothetical protein
MRPFRGVNRQCRQEKKMKHSVAATLLAAILAVSVAAVSAQQSTAAARAAAERLVGLLNINQNSEQMIQTIQKSQESFIGAQKLSDEEKKKVLDQLRTTMETVMKPVMEKTAGISVDVYAQTFTVEELEGLIAFYQSPIGRKFLEKQPQLMNATMLRTAELIQGVMPEIQRKMQEQLTGGAQKK